MDPISEYYRDYELEVVPVGNAWQVCFFPAHPELPAQPTVGKRAWARFESVHEALKAAREWIDELLTECRSMDNVEWRALRCQQEWERKSGLAQQRVNRGTFNFQFGRLARTGRGPHARSGL
jgi:hypothetical protein